MLGTSLRWLAPAALLTLSACGGCGRASPAGTSGAAPTATAEASASRGAAPPGPSALATAAPSSTTPADVPQIVDLGHGRGTAALRAALKAYGIPFDEATLERECQGDDGGASLDDLDDAATKHGLDTRILVVPIEHLLLPEAHLLPAIVIVEGPSNEEERLLAWRLDGDRVQVMSPRVGRRWLPRAELRKSLFVHAMTLAADDYRHDQGEPAFGDALEARMAARGLPAAASRALRARAAGDPGWRGFGALDAALRKLEGDDPDGGVDGTPRLSALLGCALSKRCAGVQPIPAAAWSVREAEKGPKGEAQVTVQGAVLLAISGKVAPDGGAPRAP